jgi:uncharacterized OB-fold protein
MNGPDLEFDAFLAAGEFRIQQCGGCGKHVFYPRLVCDGCGLPKLEWRIASGRGTVYATSTVNRRADKGGPYNVVLVDLDEGPRMMSCVQGIDSDAVQIGMAVIAKIEAAPAGRPRIVFEPASGKP